MGGNLLTYGVEIELYSIVRPEYRICREIYFPKKGTVEIGEKFKKDTSIGIEYNSKVFTTVREALFLLKNGLRKYIQHYSIPGEAQKYVAGIMPVGGWRDRFAATHFHIGKQRGIMLKEAVSLSRHIHDHIPFLIAICANSPVWGEELTKYASIRLGRGNEYCETLQRGQLNKALFKEMRYNAEDRTKPGTLELRMCDSNIPEFVSAALLVIQVICMGWTKRKPTNLSSHMKYLKSREQAVRKGASAELSWNNRLIDLQDYVDLIFEKYRREIKRIDPPEDVLNTFRYLKCGWNGSRIIREAVRKSYRYHPQTWQKRFAKRYVNAIRLLLDGGQLKDFAKQLKVSMPDIRKVELG